MASCCRAGPCEEMFGAESTAREDMYEYLRKGLGALESAMVEALPSTVPGGRVLEIGGGVGAIQAEILRRAGGTGEVIELVQGYGPFAARLAEQLGIADKTSFRVHDLLDDPQAVEPADVVVMNRVVCCSAEGPELASVASRLTRMSLVMSFPRATVLAKTYAVVQRFVARLMGRKYRAYVWPAEQLIAAGEDEGLTPVADGGDWLWRYVVLSRTA